MLTLGPDVQVHLALGATDMRKSYYTLAALVQEAVGQDPMSGHLFAFCNRGRDRMKVLYWDRTGYIVLAKRLEHGKFSWPKPWEGSRAIEMTRDELVELLSGVQVERTERAARSGGWYDWHAPPRSHEKQRSEVRA